MIVGIILLLIGITLVPFGIKVLKEELTVLEDLPLSKKIRVVIVEIFDVFSFDNYLSWLLSLGILLILSGIVFIIFSI